MTADESGSLKSSQVLHLEAALEGDRVRISLACTKSGRMQTMRQIEDLRVPMERIDNRCRTLVQFLNQANRRGGRAPEVLARLQENGQLFRDELFSATIKQQLDASDGDTLVLTLDDALVHIPWELMHDGRDFLGQRFSMGRVVRTRRPVPAAKDRTLHAPLRLFVLADPCGDLKAAYDEGTAIRDLAEEYPELLEVLFRSEGVDTDFVKARLRRFDLIHFAGHADGDGRVPGNDGWRLGGGRLTTADVHAMAGTGSMPALIFANACQSAHSRPPGDPMPVQPQLFDLAHAFLLAGVKHYLGAFWDIPDEAGRLFALGFYRALTAGQPVGAAVRAARRGMIEQFGEASLIWAGYLLYGDPASVYFPAGAAERRPSAPPEHEAPQPPNVPVRTRSPEDTLDLSASGRPRRSRIALRALAAVLLIAAGILGFRLFFPLKGDPAADERQALSAFMAGDYDRVRQACADLQRTQPQRALCYVLPANIHFYQGELEKAHALYVQGMQAGQGPGPSRAEALIGLGRIASVRGNTEQALDYYRRAADLAPGNEQPLVAQAVLLEKTGRPDQAVQLLEQAKAVTSDPRSIELLALQIQNQIAAAGDQQRRERIDRLVEELSGRVQSDPAAGKAIDSSGENRPLTIWISELSTVGYNLQEGTATLVAGGLAERLVQTPHIRVVERSLLEGLMTELKMGSSQLADETTRLQLGRLTAAHIIVAGRIVHSPPSLQITLRCIETESGEVFAVVSGHFDQQTGAAAMADQLADELLAGIGGKYPLKPVP